VTERASRNRVVCRDREVPEGWVVVAVYHNPACPGDGDNALAIKRPGRRELVWAESPIPEGFMAIRTTRSQHCPGDGDNALLIERDKGAR
jgi:hypothetical protein